MKLKATKCEIAEKIEKLYKNLLGGYFIMKRKFISLKLLPLVLSVVLLVGCNNTATPQTNTETKEISVTQTSSNSASAVTSSMITYDKEDYYSEWKNENPNYIELNGTSASSKASGLTIKDNVITITTAGVYAISGKLAKGQIVVDVQNKETVKLVLNGMEIQNTDSAAIYIKNAGKTIITLADGTKNIVTDGEKYVFPDATTDEPNAAIFSKSNLIINGAGTLTVNGKYNNGITSKDDLKITGGNINIYAVDDALMGKDMVLVKEGNINIEAEGDGIKSTNDSDAAKGFIALEGGTFNIKAGADGIQAETSLLIKNGKYTIVTGGGSVNSSDKVNENNQGPWGKTGNNTAVATNTEAETKSAKAIKASADITITGGSFNIDSSDDAIHSNNSITIEGEEFVIASGDDGIHADSTITIKDGKINILKSYEGIESSIISIIGGDIHVVAKDDGINVAGGNDASAIGGRPGQNTFTASNDNKLIISGGYIYVDSTGDGLDSNGSISMTGGTVIVNGPTANGNGSLDYDGTFDMIGGFLIAAGSSGMAQAPSEQSTQYSIIMTYPNTQKAGTLVNVKDSKGNTVVTFAPSKQYQSVVISSPELKKGSEYTIYTGGTSTGALTDGLYKNGVYTGENKLTTFTIANSITWLNESGVTTAKSSNMGGPGGAPNMGVPNNGGGFGGKGNGENNGKP